MPRGASAALSHRGPAVHGESTRRDGSHDVVQVVIAKLPGARHAAGDLSTAYPVRQFATPTVQAALQNRHEAMPTHEQEQP